MYRMKWMILALLLLPLVGCARKSVPAAPTATEQPTPTATPTEAPLDGVWTAEAEGLSFTLTLYEDGRFCAVSTETAGTVRTARVEGSYTRENGELRFLSGDTAYCCAAEWTADGLTLLQEGFAPLLLTRSEGTP